jgi:hypothetical protein
MKMKVHKVWTIGALLIVACQDKAQPDYAACIQSDAAGDVGKAWDSCTAAVGADPNSTSGKAAAAKLIAMRPAHDKWKADQAAKAAAAAEAQRKVDEARAKAEAEARTLAVAAARDKVRPKYDGFDPDATCTAKGLPPYRKDYGGGTLAEDQMIAQADGCQPLFPGRDDPMLAVTFCCPR